MKKKLLCSGLAFIAAGIIAAAAMPVFPASAAYTRDDDSIQKRFPEVWTDPDTGTVYYSNWSNKEGKYKALYSTDSKPYSLIQMVLPQDAISEDDLYALCKKYFDATYEIGSGIWQESDYGEEPVLHATITDKPARAETEQKCDQLFEALNEKYELVEFTYRMNIQKYSEHTHIDSWLCTYHYNTAAASEWHSTKDPQTGEKLTALIAEKYPDWEVKAYIGETGESYSVRKKGCELYDVPAPEYLDIAYTIKKKLGYQTGNAALAMDYYYPAAIKYYLYPMGDVSMDGVVDVTDAQSVLKIYAENLAGNTPQLQTEQIKAADVNADGKIDSTDAQLILLYYVQNTLADTQTSWEELLSAK